MNSTPRFSVVIPVCNASGYIRQALRSVALARGAEFLDYVFVQDDGSDDETVRAAESAFSEFCLSGVVLRNGRRLGIEETRRRACEAVESPVIMFVDADTVVRRDRFVEALHLLTEPTVSLVGGDIHSGFLQGAGEIGQRIRFPVAGADIAAASLFFNPIPACVSSWRRSALDEVQQLHASAGEDWLFAHRVIQAFGHSSVANTGSILSERRLQAVSRDSDSLGDPMPGMFSEVLLQAIKLDATQAEIELHAKVAGQRDVLSASLPIAEVKQWRAWADKLMGHARASNFVPEAVSRCIQQISCELERPRDSWVAVCA